MEGGRSRLCAAPLCSRCESWPHARILCPNECLQLAVYMCCSRVYLAVIYPVQSLHVHPAVELQVEMLLCWTPNLYRIT